MIVNATIYKLITRITHRHIKGRTPMINNIDVQKQKMCVTFCHSLAIYDIYHNVNKTFARRLHIILFLEKCGLASLLESKNKRFPNY